MKTTVEEPLPIQLPIHYWMNKGIFINWIDIQIRAHPLENDSHTMYNAKALLVCCPPHQNTHWRKLSHLALILLNKLHPQVPITDFEVYFRHSSEYFIAITRHNKDVPHSQSLILPSYHLLPKICAFIPKAITIFLIRLD